MANPISILLRDVTKDDIEIFYKQESDPVTNLMAAFAPRELAAFRHHWQVTILGNSANIAKTIVVNDEVVGSLNCWQDQGTWLIGYWIGREHWGKGFATAALQQLRNQASASVCRKSQSSFHPRTSKMRIHYFWSWPFFFKNTRPRD